MVPERHQDSQCFPQARPQSPSHGPERCLPMPPLSSPPRWRQRGTQPKARARGSRRQPRRYGPHSEAGKAARRAEEAGETIKRENSNAASRTLLNSSAALSSKPTTFRQDQMKYLGSRAHSTHLINNSACDPHPIQDGDVNNGRHAPVVDGLGAVGPHVWTLRQVDITGTQAETGNGGHLSY